MGQRFSYKSNLRVHPALDPPQPARLFAKPTREYLSEGRTLVHTPAPQTGPRGSSTLVFADGSYIIGFIHPDKKHAEGYCEYRDIANRLIYTGYMNESTYNGWGSIWDESGLWPEYTTYWTNSRPGNRVLHTTPIKMEWDLTFEDKKSDLKKSTIPSLPSNVRAIYDNIRTSFINHTIGSTEPYFREIIQLYTNIRSNIHHTPPSPNIGPSVNQLFNKRVNDMAFHPLTPPTPPKSYSPDKITVFNPLRVRIPPDTDKT